MNWSDLIVAVIVGVIVGFLSILFDAISTSDNKKPEKGKAQKQVSKCENEGEEKNESIFTAYEKGALLKEIECLKARLQYAHVIEKDLKSQIQQKEEDIQKYKKEKEQIEYQFKQSEENLKSELMEIVWDLMEQEKKKRDEFEEAKDEEAFDKLDETYDDLEIVEPEEL